MFKTKIPVLRITIPFLHLQPLPRATPTPYDLPVHFPLRFLKLGVWMCVQKPDADPSGVYYGNKVLLVPFLVEALYISACRGTLGKCGQKLFPGMSSPFPGLVLILEHFFQHRIFGF